MIALLLARHRPPLCMQSTLSQSPYRPTSQKTASQFILILLTSNLLICTLVHCAMLNNSSLLAEHRPPPPVHAEHPESVPLPTFLSEDGLHILIL